jgi:hypothetical protein
LQLAEGREGVEDGLIAWSTGEEGWREAMLCWRSEGVEGFTRRTNRWGCDELAIVQI